jgi:lipopolysaccharide biosynthesis regulator YciM
MLLRHSDVYVVAVIDLFLAGFGTSATLEELERRVIALEKAQSENTGTLRWVAGTLGQIQAVQDDHTQRLDRMEKVQTEHTQLLNDHTKVLNDHTRRLDDHTQRLNRIEGKVDGLARDLPTIVGEAVRDALKPSGKT